MYICIHSVYIIAPVETSYVHVVWLVASFKYVAAGLEDEEKPMYHNNMHHS